MGSCNLLEDGVYLYCDSCNVYAVRATDAQRLTINAGTVREGGSDRLIDKWLKAGVWEAGR